MTRTSEAARAFEARLREALALEAQVQEYEQATLGLEDPATLNGYRLERRLRLDRDKQANEAGRSFAVVALVPPRPADIAGTRLGRRELTLLTNLGRAYEASRPDPIINQYISANSTFLKTADWSMRDRAVVLRDQIIERESAFTHLIEDAKALLSGAGDAGLLETMEATLAEIAPETQEKAPDLSVLVIQDEALRVKVLTELQVMLKQQPGLPPPPPQAAELLPRVTVMQRQIVERAQLREVIAEHMQVETELEGVEAELEAAIDGEDIEARMDLVRRKVELTRRHNELGAEWFGTDPDPELYPELVKDQDALIRRMMQDLGPRGALFGARYDTVRDLAATATETTLQRWALLQAQQDLIASLAAAKPEPDPLDGMLPLAALVKARPPPPPPPALATAGSSKPGAKPGAKSGAQAGPKSGPKAATPKAAPKPKKKPPKAKGKPGAKKPGGGAKPR